MIVLWRPFLIPLGQFPLFELPEISLSSLTLPEGIYGFVFALDDKPDGIFGVTWLDLVIVVSQAQGKEIEEIPHFDGIFMEKMKELIRQNIQLQAGNGKAGSGT